MKTKTSLFMIALFCINSWCAFSQLVYSGLVYQDDAKSQYFTYNKTTGEYEVRYGGDGKVTKHSRKGGNFKPSEGITAAYMESEDVLEGGTYREYGFLDSNFKVIIPFKYKSVENFSKGVALVTTDGKYHELIDKTGKRIQAFTADNAFSLGADYIVVKQDKQFCLYDRTGKYVSISKYEDISAPGSSLARVKYQNKYGYIDGNWREAIPMIYENAEQFQNGYALVSTGYMQWGFIDTTGKVVVPCRYQNADSFSEGLAAVQQDELWGYIDATGKVVIPLKFLFAGNFKNGRAPVTSTDNAEYTINIKGERIE